MENLPVYGAIVVVLLATGAESTFLDVLALVVIGARVLHTLVHVAFEQTSAVTFCRSMLFNLQWLAMIAMAVDIALTAA